MRTPSSQSSAPVATVWPSARRLEELDALRAFALLGILMVNVQFFADPARLFGVASEAGPLGTAVLAGVSALFSGKFYILFSALFGYGFVLLWNAVHERGRDVAPVALRRFAMLFVLGLSHAILLFTGDILVTYAVAGALMLMCRNVSIRAARRTAIAIWIAMCAVLLLLTGVLALTEPLLAGDPMLREALQGPTGAQASITDSPASYLAFNASLYPQTLASLVFGQGPIALAMFFLGLAAGKARLLERGVPVSTLKRIVVVGLCIGLPGAAFTGWAAELAGSLTGTLAAYAAATATGPFLTAAYVAALLLWFRSPSGAGARDVLAPAGRMALSNYLGQSLVLALLFTGYGLALADRVHPLGVTGIVLVVFGCQLAISRWWLTGHRYGPVEWLLRFVTYAGRTAR